MTPAEINELAKEVHILNRKWWPENIHDRNKGEISILIVSEICECMEGERKDLMDDKIPHRKMAEVEMADAAIRVLDVMGAHNYLYTERSDFGADFSNNKGENLYALIGILTVGPYFNIPGREVFSVLLRDINKYCEMYGYDLWGAVREKLEYNKTRYDHSDEGRAAVGGKKW